MSRSLLSPYFQFTVKKVTSITLFPMYSEKGSNWTLDLLIAGGRCYNLVEWIKGDGAVRQLRLKHKIRMYIADEKSVANHHYRTRIISWWFWVNIS